MRDPTLLLRRATRRAKSDVANKLVSMFLHELSRKMSQDWAIRVEGIEYGDLVRKWFNSQCPYCGRSLEDREAIIEHLDGMNRYRVGLHVPGNVLVACKDCNLKKRADDALKELSLADSGWASFLSHDGTRCATGCPTCGYWKGVWPEVTERKLRLSESVKRIRSFRREFPEFERALPHLRSTLPGLLTKLYSDCQRFAKDEIASLLERFNRISAAANLQPRGVSPGISRFQPLPHPLWDGVEAHRVNATSTRELHWSSAGHPEKIAHRASCWTSWIR